MRSSSCESTLLTKDQILAAPEQDYMNADQLIFFRHLLLQLYDATLARIREVREQMTASFDSSDDSGRATWEEPCSIALDT